ncbi:hypothetical protein [Phenylobacterium sp.]|uniref:hypothetical protein n=1 Tax=Phenylobacterium sp. TaxID=1871053 RepID=UPI002FC86EA2
MKPFNIKLSDEHRVKLEAYRASRGLRSEADAVRDLIERSAATSLGLTTIGTPPMARAEAVESGKPFKSRLKGDWKAP